MCQLVESATIIAAQHRCPMCYICNKPRAIVEVANSKITTAESNYLHAVVDSGASIQKYYDECRSKASNPNNCWVGD